MRRRGFIRALLAGLAAGPAILKAAPAVPNIPACAPGINTLRHYSVDIRKIIAENMLMDIQREEDKAFIAAVDAAGEQAA